MTTPIRKPVLSLTRDLLRVYDQRFLQVEQPVRRQVVTATKGMLGGLLTADLRQELPERERLRAFCIENELFEELERLIADEVAGHREGAVVVGGRVYAVYPYLRGVSRHDADITAEVGVEHRLESMAWSRGVLKVGGWARIARIAAKDPAVRLLADNGEEELVIETEPVGEGFEALLDLPAPGTWTVRAEVRTLGLSRTCVFGTHLSEAFRLPPERAGTAFDLDAGLRIIRVPREAGKPRRSWRFWR